ncbi:MAG: HAMP domain-containing sensor histidine kinase [Bryobacteraceae bacterium]
MDVAKQPHDAGPTVFAAAGWLVVNQASNALHDGVEKEVRSSLDSIDAAWQSRAEHLSIASALLASMSDVRAAFGTRDTATIRDTAGELWARAQAGHADASTSAFAVAGPGGTVLAVVGGQTPAWLANGNQLPPSLLDPARRAFPKQSTAFVISDGTLWQVLSTPVYVNPGERATLLNILIAAHPVSAETLRDLKDRTGGSDFLLRVGGLTALSTVSEDTARKVVSSPKLFAVRPTVLNDGEGKALAELWAVRSFAGVEASVADLQRNMVISWVIAMSVGLLLSYFLARRIVRPVRALIQAAQQVSREDYSARVPEETRDELGVLARTFNHMSESIEESRAEQVRSGQITAVGRLAASIAHDLRNPLAAILGGSEMLAEFDLPADQMKQTGIHIHTAAQRMEKLLSEIGKVARAEPGRRVHCEVAELVGVAIESQQDRAGPQSVAIRQDLEAGLFVDCEKSRIERVLINLLANALEVLPNGGEISIEAARSGGDVRIDVSDSGPGVPAEIRAQLFQPFVSAGKTNGLGLGLALARQTVREHGGDLELVPGVQGARFRLRLPLAQP